MTPQEFEEYRKRRERMIGDLDSAWLEGEWEKIVTEVMTEVDRNIDMKIAPESLKQKYMRMLADYTLQGLRKSITWRQVQARYAEAVGPCVDYVLSEYNAKTAQIRSVHADLMKRHDAKLQELIDADPKARTLMLARDMIEETLPLSENNRDANTQAIRSRGMVMAAIMGLTHLGSGQVSTENKDTAKQYK
jgi:hypothetical protein